MASSDPHAPAELKKIWLTKTRSWPPRRAADELTEDRLPFVVGEPRGVGERAAMGLARRVRPEMMAVRREMNASGLRRAELGEMPAQIERHHALGLAA